MAICLGQCRPNGRVMDSRRGVSEFVFGHCAAMLVSNWTVCLPVTMAVYAFPLPVQIQLVGFAGAFWMSSTPSPDGAAGSQPRSSACSSVPLRAFRSANGERTDSIDIMNA